MDTLGITRVSLLVLSILVMGKSQFFNESFITSTEDPFLKEIITSSTTDKDVPPVNPCIEPATLNVSQDARLSMLVFNLTCQRGVNVSVQVAPQAQRWGYVYNKAFSVNLTGLQEEHKIVFYAGNISGINNLTVGTVSVYIQKINATFMYELKQVWYAVNHPPRIFGASFSVSENQVNLTFSTTVEDDDKDHNWGHVTLTATGLPRQLTLTGKSLFLKEPFDYEAMRVRNEDMAAVVSFMITATDGGGLTSSANFSLKVNDENDNTPVCERDVRIKHGRFAQQSNPNGVQKLTYLDEAGPGTINMSRFCTDQDSGHLRALIYFVDGKDCNGAIVLEPYSLVLSLRQTIPNDVISCDVAVVVIDEKHATVFSFAIVFQDCPSSVDFTNFTWPPGSPGSYTPGSCPEGTWGDARRLCGDDGVYKEPIYNCTNRELYDLYMNVLVRTLNTSSAMSQVRQLTQKVENNTLTLYTGDVEKISSILSMISANPPSKGEQERVTPDFLDTVNVIIDENNTRSWRSIVDKNGYGVERILYSVETLVKNIAQNNMSTQTQTFAKSNLFLNIESREKCHSDISIPDMRSKQTPSWAATSANRINIGCRENVVFSSAIYRNLSKMTSSKTADNVTSQTEMVNGPVMSLSIHPAMTSNLEHPVTITFQLFDKTLVAPLCSYWNFSDRRDGSGSWSTDGCHLASFDRDNSIVVCKCYHLTNFAVLMSLAPETVDSGDSVLNTITLVGCIVSMICLLVVVVLYLRFWKQVSSERSLILVNLCLSLFVAYLILIVGPDKTSNQAGCKVVAVLLHYVLLAVFNLMLALGLVLVKSVIFPFSRTKLTRFFLPGSYILPAIIVAISMGATQLKGYGNSRFCWLSGENGLIWAFVGPFILIMVVNIIIIIVVMRKLFGTVGMNKKTEKEKAIVGLRGLAVLVPVLGITWLLGIFAGNHPSPFIQYLYAIFNSLQGLLIMISNCLLDKKVQAAVRPHLRFLSGSTSSQSQQDTSSSNKTSKATTDTAL